MGFQVHFCLLIGLLVVLVFNSGYCADITTTEIKTVTDENRYLTLNPGVTLRPFNKVNHVKGNIIFSSGQRIDGDRLVVSYMDDAQFTRLTDVEVSIWYPASGQNGASIISYCEIIVALSSDADAYFVNAGGIGKTYAEILMISNQTDNFGYQLYLYGY